jgi:hypothetical protein
MTNRNTTALLVGIGALVCAGTSLGGLELTEGPFSSSFAETTDWGPVNLNVPQFNEMGGARQLTKVIINWGASVAGSARVESLDEQPSMITVTLAADISISGPSAFGVNPTPSDARMFAATAFDGTIDFGGTSGTTYPEITDGETGMTMYTNPGDLTPFIGAGNVTFVAQASAVSSATGPGNVIQQLNTDAGAGVEVTYEYIEIPNVCRYPADVEPNDYCDPLNVTEYCSIVNIAECGKFIDGKLEKRIVQGCEPDTFLVLFNKTNGIVASDDNSSNKGNGWASGLFGVNSGSGIVDNGDGTRGIRIGVTGRPDGLDGVFNGLFQNGPHGQLGKFTLFVTFLDGAGTPLVAPILPGGGSIDNPVAYTDEFITGAEAFHINYTLPQGAVSVNVCIDNSVPCEEIREDVDFFCLENLVPLCDYCITQIGGLDCECIPTATAIGWFDKSCDLILKEQGNEPIPGYTKLCVVADANGRVVIAVSGAYDCNFNGIHDEHEVEAPLDRAPIECPEINWGHGVAGCYTLCVEVVGAHGGGTDPNDAGDSASIVLLQNAMDHGDLNMDGATDTADLGILLGNFGWTGQ